MVQSGRGEAVLTDSAIDDLKGYRILAWLHKLQMSSQVFTEHVVCLD